MASADDAHSRPKRPAAMTRQSSSQSHMSQSPSDTHQKAAHHKAQRHHVVGQRVQRNASFGKNLNKLNKAAQQVQQAQQAAEKEARHHRRSQSGNTVSAPSSPRPSFKRNASSGGIVRAAHQAHTQTNLRKNHSSGHLARQGQTKHALKSSKSEVAPPKKSLAQPTSRPTSPEGHPTVHFDVGSEDEAGDDGWTEGSGSQSPTTTRSNTRSNSVIIDAQHKLAERNMENNRGDPSQATATRQAPTQTPQTLPDRTRNSTASNGQGSHHHHSRPPDADMITSRLLQRSASHTVPPQTTSVAATVATATARHNVLTHSAGSTLVDTPGKDLVSRFMDGDGSAGTPRNGGYMPSRQSDNPQGSELTQSKRNKSMPNVGGADTPNRTPSRSGATTPTTNLPPSRTQQKLMLQRASSNISPQKLVPVTLPRAGGPTFLQSGIHYNANGEGRLDPRLQQQFNHVAIEYNVVRRYRNPLADSIVRIQQLPGMSVRKARLSRTGSANGSANSLSTSLTDAVETDGAGARRSRAQESGRPASRRGNAGEGEGRRSFESEGARRGIEAEEICRRLWESAEVGEGD